MYIIETMKQHHTFDNHILLVWIGIQEYSCLNVKYNSENLKN